MLRGEIMSRRSAIPRVRTPHAGGPCATCTHDCAGCVFAERAAEARAEGDDEAVGRALAQMARHGCRRLQVNARSRTGLARRLASGAAAAALVLSLGLTGCETDTGGRGDTYGVDASEVLEVAILPADAMGGDGAGEVYAILPPECTTDADCTEQFYQCVDGTCQQTMFPVMPQCQTNDDCAANEECKDGACQPIAVAILPPACTTDADCAANEECKDGACEPIAVAILPPACTTNDDCAEHEMCTDGACQPAVSILPACTTDADCQPGEACKDGFCEPQVYPVLPPPDCTSDADCDAGQACVDGTCAPAPIECSIDADCPEGQTCVGGCPDEDGGVLCILPVKGTCQVVVSVLPACASDADCNTPIEACVDGQCQQVMWPVMPMCTSDADCATGEACVDGSCQAVEPVSCGVDADCPEGQTCEGECPSEDGQMMCILPVKGVCTPMVNPASCTSDADCVPGDECVGGCPQGMFCILPMGMECKTPCAADADCDANETCVGVVPDQQAYCEPGYFAILPPSPKPAAPPVKATGAWRSYVEGALAWFRADGTKTGRS